MNDTYNLYEIERQGVTIYFLEARAWFCSGFYAFNTEQARNVTLADLQRSCFRMTSHYLWRDSTLITDSLLHYYFDGAVFSKLENREVYVA